MAQAPKKRRGLIAETPQTADDAQIKLVTQLDARVQSLDSIRYSWWLHWRDLAEYLLPRRMRWLYPYNQNWNRGSPLNQNIINNTGTIAARTLAAGMLAGTTSPAKPWFRLAPTDKSLVEEHEVKVWLEEARNRMMRIMAASNYYTSKGVQLMDEVVFGTSPMFIYEHPDKVIHCYVPTPGEYFCAANGDFEVDSLYRRYPLSLSQVVSTFGLDALPDDLRQLYESGGASLNNEIIISHACEPNPGYSVDAGSGLDGYGVPKAFRYREVYWLWGRNGAQPLRIRGFNDKPFSVLRWDVFGNDAYGRSPGMDALGDVKQLQFEEKRKAQAIDKSVRPPMVADASMKNEPASLLPGAVTYVPQLGPGTGFRPVFQVPPILTDLIKDIQGVEMRIKDTFFNGLFQILPVDSAVRTATEIDVRQQEKMILLGPVLERNDTEGLGPDIKRIFAICARMGVFPPMPDQLRNTSLKIEYVSMLSELQRGSMTTAIERTLQLAGNLVAVTPDIMDNLDTDVMIREYGGMLRLDPRTMRPPDSVLQIRQARSAQEQAAVGLQTGATLAQGAKTLSETDTSGQNLLAAMLGQIGGPGG
jgi:hypothetical protein